MAFALGGKAGVDFTKIYSGTAPFVVGDFQHTGGTSSTGYRFVRYTTAKTIGVPYLIGTDWTLGNEAVTAGVTVAPVALGVPQVAFTAPDSTDTYAYAWVAVIGVMSVFAAGASSANVEIYTASVSGMVASATAGKLIQGLKLTAAPGSTAISALASAYAINEIRVPTDA